MLTICIVYCSLYLISFAHVCRVRLRFCMRWPISLLLVSRDEKHFSGGGCRGVIWEGARFFRVLGQRRQALTNWPFSGSTPGVLPTPVITKRANSSKYNDKGYPQGKLQRGGDRLTLAGTYSAQGRLLRKHKARLRH